MAPPRQRGLAAVAAGGGTGSSTLIETGRPKLPTAALEAFCPDPRNHRANLGDLQDLAARMRKHGQLQPVVCVSAAAYRAKFPDVAAQISYGADYVVIMGNRRLHAAPLAELETLSYTLNDRLLESDDYREAALDENWRREDLTCLDDARILAEFLALDGTHKAVAARVERSEGFVAQRLRLLTLAPDVQDAIDAHRIGFDAARRLCALDHPQQLAELAILLQDPQDTDDETNALKAKTRTGAHPASPKPPTTKTAGRVLSRYKNAYGADAVAALVREEMNDEELTTFVTAAVAHMGPASLDSLLNALTQSHRPSA